MLCNLEGRWHREETCTFSIYCTRTALVMAILMSRRRILPNKRMRATIKMETIKTSKKQNLQGGSFILQMVITWKNTAQKRKRRSSSKPVDTVSSSYFSLGLQQEKQEEGNAAWMKQFPKPHQLSVYIYIFRTFTFCPSLGSESSSFTPRSAFK